MTKILKVYTWKLNIRSTTLSKTQVRKNAVACVYYYTPWKHAFSQLSIDVNSMEIASVISTLLILVTLRGFNVYIYIYIYILCTARRDVILLWLMSSSPIEAGCWHIMYSLQYPSYSFPFFTSTTTFQAVSDTAWIELHLPDSSTDEKFVDVFL